jgi:hypothetical protein
VGDATDDVGEQQLRQQHRQNAGEAHAERGIAENGGAEADEPGDHGRMIEKGQHAFL